MSVEDLVGSARRDWAAVSAAKERDWLRRKQRLTPNDLLQPADDLRRHVQSIRPDWPSDADRRADLDVHSRVGHVFRAVARPAR